MKLAQCLLPDQIFTHVDPTGVTRHFNASAILRAILRKELAQHCRYRETHVSKELSDFIEANHGIEQDRIESLPDSCLREPILLACFDGGMQTLIDGNHRYVKAYRKGKATLPAIWIDRKGWEPYLVEDMNEHMPLEIAIPFLDKIDKSILKK